MTQVAKTAKIPLLDARLGSPFVQIAAGGGETNSTAEQWAERSEQTLTQLRQGGVRKNQPARVLDIPVASFDGIPQVDAKSRATATASTSVAASEAPPGARADRDLRNTPEEDDRVSTTIQNMVELITKRSTDGVAMLLLCIGSEPNLHTDETAARLASALCEQTASRVLLIDSDTDSRNLTTAARLEEGEGMTEVIQRNRNWSSLLLRNEHTNLDFLPCGRESFQRWNQQELLRKASCEMRKNYQFICVSAGDAHGKAAKLWSDVCDGSFLLVSVKNSNRTVAKSAVTELQSGGARLLGCIVTDAE